MFGGLEGYEVPYGMGDLDPPAVLPANWPSWAGTREDFDRRIYKLNQVGYAAPDTSPTDPDVEASTKAFQSDVYPDAGKIDGFLGPNTEAALDRQLAKRALPVPDPSIIVPPAAPAAPGPAPAAPAVAAPSNTKLYVGIGLGVAALAAGAYYLTK